MPVIKDLTGKRFGRLTVLDFAGTDNGNRALWLCKCDCGTIRTVTGYNLTSGKTKSCGCLSRELLRSRNVTHGKTDTKIYLVWKQMINRCESPKNKSFDNYGGRGIRVCEEWHDFEKFYEWSIANGYKEGLTIERKDVNKGYCLENCCWIRKAEQSKNRRSNRLITYKGETKILSDWAIEYGIDRRTLRNRIDVYGWGIEEALKTPAYVGRNSH